MIVKCPKCGFSQPQDQYCAQCGVDMEAYRPAHSSNQKGVLQHPAFQISVVVILIIAAVAFLYKKDRSILSARIDYLKTGPQIATSSALDSSEETTSNSDAATDLSSNGNLPPPTPEASANTENLVSSPTTQEEIVGPRLHVTYVEISRAGLLKLIDEAQAQGEFADFRDYATGVINQFSEKSSQFLYKTLWTEDIPLKEGSASWFHGIRDRIDPRIELGFTSFANVQRAQGNRERVNIEIERNWKESNEQNEGVALVRREYPIQAEISPDMAIFVTGLMPPRGTGDDLNKDLTSQPIFKILESADFQSRQSDFVVIIELKE